MTDASASRYLSKKPNRAMEVLSEGMNSVWYIQNADFRDLDELRGAFAGEARAESVEFLLSDPPYSVRRQSELENTSQIVFGLNEMDEFCDLAAKLINPGSNGYVFYSAFQLSQLWQTLQSLMEVNEVANDGNAKKLREM